MGLALSTSWTSARLTDASALIATVSGLGVNALELEYRLEPAVFYHLKPLLLQAGIRVTSLHNYCPHPALNPKSRPSGDYFRLSALDRDEHRLAVEWTRKTMEQANDLEAGVVVLHCGEVSMPDPGHREIKRLWQAQGGDSEAFRELIDLQTARRAQHAPPCLDALFSALDRLLPLAEKFNLTLGIENRYHYHQLPGFEELAAIFKEFAGGPIGYWHDTGHAHVCEQLGLVAHNALIDSYGARLVGMHIHDAQGLTDHLPPGSGQIDFSVLAPYLGGSLPIVLELAPGTDLDRVRLAVSNGRQLITRFGDRPSSNQSSGVAS